jgi:hypothetical protein
VNSRLGPKCEAFRAAATERETALASAKSTRMHGQVNFSRTYFTIFHCRGINSSGRGAHCPSAAHHCEDRREICGPRSERSIPPRALGLALADELLENRGGVGKRISALISSIRITRCCSCESRADSSLVHNRPLAVATCVAVRANRSGRSIEKLLNHVKSSTGP